MAAPRSSPADEQQDVAVADVDVLVLAHNQHARTARCLAHLAASNATGFTTYLIDNGSMPALQELLTAYPGRPTVYLANETNLSYSRANNRAAAKATGTYLLLLNNDCYVGPDCLSAMRRAFALSDRIGIVGAKLLYPGEERAQHCGVLFANGYAPHHFARGSSASRFITSLRGEWPAVTGACLMIRRDVWEVVGGLAEEYEPGGYEDTDLCLKARERGLAVWYEPSAKAIHEESATASSFGPAYQEFRRHNAQQLFELFCRTWMARYANLNALTPRRLV